jgi:TetR/AcrR family transcriptional regulator, ethionamide resistance regulator
MSEREIMSDAKRPQFSRRVVPTPSLKIGKSDRTRAAILNSALDYLWLHPFREMTVNSLMTSIGASRATFYQYFSDLHDLMETLLRDMQDEVFDVTAFWFQGEGDPILLLEASVEGLVRVCYREGPILRAVSDAAPMDPRLEKSWRAFKKVSDDAVTQRIEQHQEAGFIRPFDARPVAIALNRMDVYLMIHHFGSRPRGNRKSVRDAVLRIWISTLYGDEALAEWLSRLEPATSSRTSRSRRTS